MVVGWNCVYWVFDVVFGVVVVVGVVWCEEVMVEGCVVGFDVVDCVGIVFGGIDWCLGVCVLFEYVCDRDVWLVW